MSGTYKIGAHQATLSAARGEGGAVTVTVSRGEGEAPIEVVATRDPDGTLALRFPDGRVQRASVTRDGARRWVTAAGRTLLAAEVRERRGAVEANPSLEAPMPGKVARVLVKVGDRVTKGQTLVTVEAMKMEHALKSPRDGVVEALSAVEGALVSPGTPLVRVGELAEAP